MDGWLDQNKNSYLVLLSKPTNTLLIQLASSPRTKMFITFFPFAKNWHSFGFRLLAWECWQCHLACYLIEYKSVSAVWLPWSTSHTSNIPYSLTPLTRWQSQVPFLSLQSRTHLLSHSLSFTSVQEGIRLRSIPVPLILAQRCSHIP